MVIRLNDNALTSREYDSNGYLIVKDNPIAKAGVFDYLGKEVNSQENPESIIKVCRTFDNLKENKDYFKGKPIKHEHKWVGENEDSDVAEGAIYGEVRADEPYLKADIIIYNPALIKKIEAGEAVELSPAYDANLIKESGAYNGETYTYRQELKSVNHLAVVECGRSGSDLRIQDTQTIETKGGAKMAQKVTFKDAISELLKRFKDEEAESQGEIQAVEDNEALAKEILEVANKADVGEAEKIQAIVSLMGKLSQTQDNDTETEDSDTETEAQDSDTETESEKETQDNDTESKSIEVDELVELIEKVADSKLKKFKDSMLKENKRVQDTYLEVSNALGTNFDYTGKSVNELYKFGYENITKQRLADGLDSKTAFKMALSRVNKPISVKVSDSKTNSKLDELIAKHM